MNITKFGFDAERSVSATPARKMSTDFIRGLPLLLSDESQNAMTKNRAAK